MTFVQRMTGLVLAFFVLAGWLCVLAAGLLFPLAAPLLVGLVVLLAPVSAVRRLWKGTA